MHTRRATRQDLPDIATLATKAMMKDEVCLYLSPDQATHQELFRERCLRTTVRRWLKGLIMLVTVTEEGDDGWDGNPRIVAYAAYEKEVGADDDSSKVSNTIFGGDYNWYFRNNLNTDKVKWQEVTQIFATSKVFGSLPRFWELDFLAVDPEFGRRGLGTQLIKWGQERATEDGTPLLLWSSYQGAPLYLRHGFKEVEKFSFGDGAILSPVMVWTPPGLDTASQ